MNVIKHAQARTLVLHLRPDAQQAQGKVKEAEAEVFKVNQDNAALEAECGRVQVRAVFIQYVCERFREACSRVDR